MMKRRASVCLMSSKAAESSERSLSIRAMRSWVSSGGKGSLSPFKLATETRCMVVPLAMSARSSRPKGLFSKVARKRGLAWVVSIGTR